MPSHYLVQFSTTSFPRKRESPFPRILCRSETEIPAFAGMTWWMDASTRSRHVSVSQILRQLQLIEQTAIFAIDHADEKAEHMFAGDVGQGGECGIDAAGLGGG